MNLSKNKFISKKLIESPILAFDIDIKNKKEIIGINDTANLFNLLSNENKIIDFEKREFTSPITKIKLDNDFAILGYLDGSIAVFNINDGKKAWDFMNKNGEGITSIDVSKDSTMVVVGSLDSKVYLYELATGKLIRTYVNKEEGVIGVKFTPLGNIIIASLDGYIRIWSVDQNKEPIITFNNQKYLTTIDSFDIQETYVYVLNNDNYVVKFDAKTGKMINKFKTMAHCSTISVSEDNKYVVLGSEMGIIYVHEAQSGILLKNYSSHSGRITQLQFAYVDDDFVETYKKIKN